MGEEEKGYLENIAKQVVEGYDEMDVLKQKEQLIRVRDLINAKPYVDIYKNDLEVADKVYKLI